MSFKKQMQKKMSDETLVQEYKTSSSQALFLFSAFCFFLNIFLVGSDKSNSYPFLQFILPLTYTLFISSLLFLSFSAIDRLLGEKYNAYKKPLKYVIGGLFILPFLVFFIQRDFDTGL